jgi:hypothetical protein
MTTGLDIITKALQKNGVLVKSEAPSSDEADDALDALNAMISAWSNDSMLIYARTEENFPLSDGVAEYTIGTSQTFNTTRPIFITRAYVRQNNTDYDLEPLTDEAYYSIADKNTSSIPKFFNFNNGFPTGKIKLWPVPNAAYTLYIQSEKELSGFTLSGNVSLPPGWEQALIYNLAVVLAPDYGEAVNQTSLALAAKIAAESKTGIMRTIMRNRSMDHIPNVRLGNFYNGWLT